MSGEEDDWSPRYNEIFADQFLAWTFDTYCTGTTSDELERAEARREWMNNHMAEWLR